MANQHTKKHPPRRPIFTLKPTDNFTPVLLQEWIRMAIRHGVDEDKLLGARGILRDIEKWRTENPTLCKTPD